jgi:MerR family redox-sensitive transcriptional activator SoxR
MQAAVSHNLLSIGEVAERTGVAASALRFYEAEGLITSERSLGGQRRFRRETIRRVAFIRIAQQVGVPLTDVRRALSRLPDGRTPTRADWARLSHSWRPMLDERIATLTRLRDSLDSCIGCGCLSLKRCALYNPEDAASARGAGARYLLGDQPGPAEPAPGEEPVGVDTGDTDSARAAVTT